MRSGWDERQATLMFTVFTDGVNRAKPIIIFKGTENEERQEMYYGQESNICDAGPLCDSTRGDMQTPMFFFAG